MLVAIHFIAVIVVVPLSGILISLGHLTQYFLAAKSREKLYYSTWPHSNVEVIATIHGKQKITS